MCPACLATILAAVAGSATGAGALAWFGRKRSLAKRLVEPPSATFQEWVAAILEGKEASQSTTLPAGILTNNTDPQIARSVGLR